MSTSPELRAHILRLHHSELWPVGTIAKQLRVHHRTVSRVLAAEGLTPHVQAPRPSRVDPYRAFIAETLAKYPTLTAGRLYVMVCERGYAGCQRHFRDLVAGMRPRPVAQAYLRLRTLPGEQAQVDWAHLGHIEVGRARRPLMAFVMVLSYSRRIFLRFFLSSTYVDDRLMLYATLVDEVGYLSYSDRHADLLFELVSRRYLAKSTVVTTNKKFAEWNQVFPSAACVVSLVDRLMHRAEVVRIDGESYRQKEAEERAAQRAAARSVATRARSTAKARA